MGTDEAEACTTQAGPYTGLAEAQRRLVEGAFAEVSKLIEDNGLIEAEVAPMFAPLRSLTMVIGWQELVQAQGGDFGLFEKLDPEGTGSVGKEAWVRYFEEVHRTKTEQHGGDRKQADHWLRDMTSTLRQGCGIPDVTSAQHEEIDHVFDLVAGLDDYAGIIKKEALVKAHGGGGCPCLTPAPLP